MDASSGDVERPQLQTSDVGYATTKKFNIITMAAKIKLFLLAKNWIRWRYFGFQFLYRFNIRFEDIYALRKKT